MLATCLQYLEDMIDVRDEHNDPFYIRRFDKNSEELAILTSFSSLRMRAEQWNHVVPIVDSFDDPDDPSVVFVVTKLLHTVEYPV